MGLQGGLIRKSWQVSAAGVGLVRVKPPSQRVIFSSQLVPCAAALRQQTGGALHGVGINVTDCHSLSFAKQSKLILLTLRTGCPEMAVQALYLPKLSNIYFKIFKILILLFKYVASHILAYRKPEI